MSVIITSEADRALLARPHISRAWFGMFDFPSGVKYLHNGYGPYTVGGQEYLGISDPLGGRLVGIAQVEEPQFGQAAAVQLVLSGVSADFIAEVKRDARALEGRSATLYWAAFDGETEAIIPLNGTGLIPLFPRGRMSAPSISRQGIGVRYVSLTIEGMWSSQNYAPGGRWNYADQLRRYPGDKGLQFVGVEVSENWQA